MKYLRSRTSILFSMRIYLLISFTICLYLSQEAEAQTQRSNVFHEKYKLKEVVVMSRHNIRAPLSTDGSPVNRVTPHKWHEWTAKAGELSLRGGVMETAMGQYFRQWVVSEKLLPDNHVPVDDEVYFYTNSLQRTFATGKYFSAGFLPYANVTIHRRYNESKMDPVFTPQFTKMNPKYKAAVQQQMNAMGGKDDFKALMQQMEPQLQLMATVIDMNSSPACLLGDTCKLFYEDTTIKIEKGDEPRMRGGYTLANSVADALILQYYEKDDSVAAAFGFNLTPEQWHQIGTVKAVYDNLLFTAPVAAVNLAYPLVKLIKDELTNSNRKFTFLCGHDSNLASLRAALNMQIDPVVDSPENNTPIGSKYVFEKWTDGKNDYVAVNLVYPRASQLREKTELSINTPPMILPICFSGLKTNEDGLYPLEVLIAHFQNVMKAYDEIEDVE